jgi:prefoldin subunit 4
MKTTKSREQQVSDSLTPALKKSHRYKIGDTFMSLPLPEVQELLTSSTSKIEESVFEVQGKLSTIREEMEQLKVQLYARFGKSINLET